MTAGRHLVHASLHDAYGERLAAKADAPAVGDPHREEGHLGPLDDDARHARRLPVLKPRHSGPPAVP